MYESLNLVKYHTPPEEITLNIHRFVKQKMLPSVFNTFNKNRPFDIYSILPDCQG